MSRGPQLPVAPFVDFVKLDICHCKIWRWLAAIGRLSVLLAGPWHQGHFLMNSNKKSKRSENLDNFFSTGVLSQKYV
jgi:hypothetical protein